MILSIIHHGRGEIAIVDYENHSAGPLWVGQQAKLIEALKRFGGRHAQ